MVHGEKVHHEAAELDFVARLDLGQTRLDAMLVELALHQTKRHLGRIDGHLAGKILHQVRQAARVIFMTVRDDDATQLMLVLQHIGVIGKNQVDAGMIVIRKHQARVHENHVVAAFERGHILADGVQTAQGNDLERRIGLALHAAATARSAARLTGAGLGERLLFHLVFRGDLRALVLHRNGHVALGAMATVLALPCLSCRVLRLVSARLPRAGTLAGLVAIGGASAMDMFVSQCRNLLWLMD